MFIIPLDAYIIVSTKLSLLLSSFVLLQLSSSLLQQLVVDDNEKEEGGARTQSKECGQELAADPWNVK